MKNEIIIINLSQRGGSHLRPLMALLNRKFPQGDFQAKSGNICLKLTTILTWINSQVNNVDDIQQGWSGTNAHNQVMLSELIPLDVRRNSLADFKITGRKLVPVKTNKQSLLCGLVWDADKDTVQQATCLLADAILARV